MHSSNGGMMQALELEPALEPEPNGQQQHYHSERMTKQPQPRLRSPVEFCQSLWALLVAYSLYYRAISIPLFVILFMLAMILLFDLIAYHSTTKTHVPQVQHDYSELQTLYDVKMAKIDHWCLKGDDDSCTCMDPNQPASRGEVKGWAKAHRLNKELVVGETFQNLDVVFVGDETIEEMNGRWLGSPAPDGTSLSKQWAKTFTKEGGGEMEGLALGVAGDYISNVLWRLNHDEMPYYLDAKVWWILVGANDLSRGQCSEEVVVLGILRLAEEIKSRYPNSIVVINSLLPRLPESKRHTKKGLDVWPSIQVVNRVLKKYCSKHEHLEYFDSTPLFFGGTADQKKGWDFSRFQSTLMPDRTHLSVQGHKVWGKAVVEKLKELVTLVDVPSYDGYDGSYQDDYADGSFSDDAMFADDSNYA